MSSQGFKKLLYVRSDGGGDPMIGPHVHMGPIKKEAPKSWTHHFYPSTVFSPGETAGASKIL